MFACPLCNDWLYVASLCPNCKETKKIVACYGIDKVNTALTSFFLREDDKINNKVKNEIITRSKKHKGVKGLDGSYDEKKSTKL